MQEFKISLRSFRQVQEFVALSSAENFPVYVGNPQQIISGKDLMGMFSLDYSRPLQVRAECSEEEFHLFRQKTAKFLI